MTTTIRKTKITQPIYVWIPPQYTANHKITITSNSTSVTDDLTDELMNLEIEDGVTELIGRFKVKLTNVNEEYSNRYAKMDVFRYYSDYDTTATTLRFKGLVETISYRDYSVEVSGRAEGVRYLGLTVTASFDNIDCSAILKQLISKVTGFTSTNVVTSGVLVTKNWIETPFFDCVSELARDCGYDVYIDATNDWHFFLHGSVENETEGATDEYNIIEVGDFASDPTSIKNQVIVYGAEQDGVQIIATAEDTDSQNEYVINREIVNDGNITSEVQAQEVADYTLAKLKDEQTVGEISCLLMANIKPGDKIPILSPVNNLLNRKYVVQSYVHKISNNGHTTDIRIEKQPRNIVHVLKSMLKANIQNNTTALNPEQMKYSYSFLFDEDVGTHTNTMITDSKLRLQAGQSSGTWLSETRSTNVDISEVYLLCKGIYLTDVTISASVDGGTIYNILSINQKQVIGVPSDSLIIKVVFSSADAEIESLSVMYK